MQKVIFKFLSITLLSMLVSMDKLAAKSTESELFTADSLYKNQQYSEAIKIYNNLFEANIYTPNMLLKMARVNEGQENYGLTIFYLEKYYRITQEPEVINHIEKITEENNLSGFSYDFPYYLNMYYQLYRYHLLFIFLSLIVVILLKEYLNQKKSSSQTRKSSFTISILILLSSCAILNNFMGSQYGITISQPTYSMKGPSAGADIYKTLDKATKVRVYGEIDIWTKASFNDREIYIKTDDLEKL